MLKFRGLRDEEWRHIQKLELCPSITSYDAYALGVVVGEAEARLTVVSEASDVPDLEYIQRIHRQFFQFVHPWAGQLNEPGDDIWFGGMLSASPTFVRAEIEQLVVYTRRIIGESTVESKARAIAYYHAKFERIHPFKDGNGRVGRLLMESQAIALFGLPEMGKDYSLSEYFRALKRAQRQNNLRTMMNLVLRFAGQPELPIVHDPSPFPMRLLFKGPRDQEIARRRAAKNRN